MCNLQGAAFSNSWKAMSDLGYLGMRGGRVAELAGGSMITRILTYDFASASFGHVHAYQTASTVSVISITP